MKKNLLVSLLVFTCVLATTSAVFSQQSGFDLSYNIIVPSLEAGSGNELIDINPKVIRVFEKSFGVTENAMWYKMKTGYSVRFIHDDVAYRVDYNKKGAWAGTLRTYEEAQLNRSVRAIIKSVYFDYAIKWVWEISIPRLGNEPVYIVHLEDDKSFKNIQVYDSEIKGIEEFQK